MPPFKSSKLMSSPSLSLEIYSKIVLLRDSLILEKHSSLNVNKALKANDFIFELDKKYLS